ncbi:MAG: VanZ family protein [Acidobacteriota bacterium]
MTRTSDSIETSSEEAESRQLGTGEENAGAPGLRRGLFSSPRRAWAAVTVYVLFLYTTLTLTYELYIWVFDWLGGAWVRHLLTLVFALLGIALLLLLLLRLPRRPGPYLIFAAIVLAGSYCLYIQKAPANQIHFLEYGPLTVLVLDALRFRCRKRSIYAWTLLLVASIGIGDELLQGMLPQRHFALEDVLLNTLAGVLTLAFMAGVMGGENYPGFHISRLGRRRDPPR